MSEENKIKEEQMSFDTADLKPEETAAPQEDAPVEQTVSQEEAPAVTENAAAETSDEPTKKKERNRRKVRIGMVVSDKMDKTIVVKVSNLVPHKLYKKAVRKSKKFKAHDEKNECRIGDRVQIMETRPLSKDKRWRLEKIVEKAK
jgi:small subunit ribosomal protein S17